MANSASSSPSPSLTSFAREDPSTLETSPKWHEASHDGTNIVINISSNDGSTGKGILIGMLSAFGSAAFVILVFAIFYFFRYTSRGRIFLDRIGRPGEYDDEQAFAREETEALEDMDDLQRAEYLRAKGEVGNFDTKKLIANSSFKPSFKRTHQKPSPPISHCLNSLQSRKRAYQPGNSSPKLRLQTVSSKGARR